MFCPGLLRSYKKLPELDEIISIFVDKPIMNLPNKTVIQHFPHSLFPIPHAPKLEKRRMLLVVFVVDEPHRVESGGGAHE